MKTILRITLVLVLIVAAVPAFAGRAVQTWKCELDGDITEEEVIAHAGKWLEAVKSVKGGENAEVQVYFPVAVDATGEIDAIVIISTPTFEEWGRLWDNYAGSAAEEMDAMAEHVICPDSAVWESIDIE